MWSATCGGVSGSISSRRPSACSRQLRPTCARADASRSAARSSTTIEARASSTAATEDTMASDTHYDIIIIGTGAGGGTLAHKLAPSGKRILILERGGYVPREKENWDSRAVNVDARYHTKEVWHDKEGKPLHPHTNYYVGGNTKFYGAALFRLREQDFGELRHHGGISPAWPITYEDLEPYYA